jgi:hypothetical protein
LKGVRWNTDKGRCPLCLGKEDAKHMLLLDCWKNMNRRFKFLTNKWLNMNKEVAYRKILG